LLTLDAGFAPEEPMWQAVDSAGGDGRCRVRI
jgi:hypothetical protein